MSARARAKPARRLAVDVLSADLAEGLTVAEIADRHRLPMDYVYGRIRRLGLKLNPAKRRVDWTGLAEQLERLHPRDVASLRDCSVASIYRVADRLDLRHLFAPARTIDHEVVRADLAAGMSVDDVAAAHGISTGSVYRIRRP